MDSFNIRHLIGNYNKNNDNKIGNKDIRYRILKKDNKNNNADEIKKIQFIKLRKLFADKNIQYKSSKTNISYQSWINSYFILYI